jgi:hypothetical protein
MLLTGSLSNTSRGKRCPSIPLMMSYRCTRRNHDNCPTVETLALHFDFCDGGTISIPIEGSWKEKRPHSGRSLYGIPRRDDRNGGGPSPTRLDERKVTAPRPMPPETKRSLPYGPSYRQCLLKLEFRRVCPSRDLPRGRQQCLDLSNEDDRGRPLPARTLFRPRIQPIYSLGTLDSRPMINQLHVRATFPIPNAA